LTVADSLAAFVSRMPKPAPTLVDAAFIIALAGFHDEGFKCMQLCWETFTDSRLLEPLVRAQYGTKQRTLLMAFAGSGNAARVKQLLDCGAPIDAKDELDYTALHWACVEGATEVACMLLDRGAEAEGKGRNDLRPLHIASVDGRESVARLLLDRGVETGACTSINRTALHLACVKGHVSVARLLLERGIEADTRDVNSCTALHLACHEGHADIARLLLSRSATLDARDARGRPRLGVHGRPRQRCSEFKKSFTPAPGLQKRSRRCYPFAT
jgi:ankyrin repeat protein